jgi:hypothetical protein
MQPAAGAKAPGIASKMKKNIDSEPVFVFNVGRFAA